MKTIRLFILLLISAHVTPSYAASGITYQGRILKPDGSALAGSNVQFRLHIRTPDSNNCLLYEEIKALDMRNSKGLFSLTLNDGSGTRTDSSGYGLDRIFANRGTFTFNSTTCSSGSSYTPSDGDGRRLQVHFKDETMSDWEPMPPTNINYVPFAFEAKQVQGFNAESLVRVQEADGTMGNIAPLSNANYLDLLNLVGGTSPNYVRASNGAGARVPVVTGNPLSPVAGSVWFDSVSGKLKFHDGSSPVDVGGGAGGGVTEVTAGSGLVTSPGAGITATGSIAIAVGGVVTNMLADGAVTTIKIGDSQVTDVKLAANSVIEAKIANGAVTSAKILDGTIAGSDLAPDITISTTGSVTASGFTTTGNVTVGGDVVVTGGVSATTVTSGTNITRQIQLFDPDTSSVNKITFTADAALNADYTLKWPLTAGSANQVLSTDGLGNLSWRTPATGTGDFMADGSVPMTGTLKMAGGTVSGVANITNSAGSITMTPMNGNSVVINQSTSSLSPSSGALIVNGGVGVAENLNVGGNAKVSGSFSTASPNAATAGANSNSPSIYLTANYWNGSASALDQWGIANVLGTGANPTSTLTFDRGPAYSSGARHYAFMNGNVGVGTTTPAAPLDVVGITRATRFSVGNNGSAAAPAIYWSGDSDTGIYRRGADELALTTAGAPRVIVDALGNVAIGNVPAIARLHVRGTDSTPYSSSGPGTSPSQVSNLVSLENDAGDDGSAQYLELAPKNSLGSYSRTYLASVTNPGSHVPTFVIGSRTGSNNYAERLRIDMNGNIGIGTDAPGTNRLKVAGAGEITGDLKVGGSAKVDGMFESTGYRIYGGGAMDAQIFSEIPSHNIRFLKLSGGGNFNFVINSTEIAQISSAGLSTIANVSAASVSAGVYALTSDDEYPLGDPSHRFTDIYATGTIVGTSDGRLKTNVRDSDLGLDFIKSLRPVSYNWKKGDRSLHYGVIAQETEVAIRNAKAKSGFADEAAQTSIVDHDTSTDRYGVRYTELIAPIVKAIQELFAHVDSQDVRLAEHERQIASVKEENVAKDNEIQRLKLENSELRTRLEKIESALNLK